MVIDLVLVQPLVAPDCGNSDPSGAALVELHCRALPDPGGHNGTVAAFASSDCEVTVAAPASRGRMDTIS